MKQTTIQQQLRLLVVPLHPTHKADFPSVSMQEYISWPNAKGSGPFNPWLRKHVKLSAQIIKVAPASMVVSGRVVEWKEWAKVDFEQVLQKMCPHDVKLDNRTTKLYVEMSFTGGFVPLRFYHQDGKCVYTEPNVWLVHNL